MNFKNIVTILDPRRRGKKGDRGYLKQFPNSDNPDEPTVTVTNPIFRLETLKNDSFTVAVNDYPLKFKITAPYQTFESIHTKSVSNEIIKAVQINSN